MGNQVHLGEQFMHSFNVFFFCHAYFHFLYSLSVIKDNVTLLLYLL